MEPITQEVALALSAGPVLDALVANLFRPKPAGQPRYIEEGAVAGPWKVVHVGAGVLEWRNILCYSSNMTAAWAAWEECLKRVGPDAWARALRPAVRLRDCEYRTVSTLAIVVEHLTPLAICQAALIALSDAAAAPLPTKREGVEL